MNISLTPEERELLVDVLEERHRELRGEISRTTHNEFKSALKEKEKRLQSVISKLYAAGGARLASIPA